MENRFDNVKKEMQIYALCFIFSGIINIAFWINFPEMLYYAEPGDGLFIFLACFASIGSVVGLTIHFLIYLRNTRDIRNNKGNK